MFDKKQSRIRNFKTWFDILRLYVNKTYRINKLGLHLTGAEIFSQLIDYRSM